MPPFLIKKLKFTYIVAHKLGFNKALLKIVWKILKSKKRNANIAVPRQIAMYICRVILEEPLTKIGIEFGGKDHTTVMHSVDKIKKQIKNDKTFELEINKLINEIK